MKPRVFLPAALSGVLLWAAFFPLDLGPLGFVALVPWLTLVRAPVGNARRYFAAYLGGFTFFGIALNWLPAAHPMMYMSWAFLAVVCPLFWCLALFFVRRLDRAGVPLALAVPVAWVATEYMRAHFPTGFPFLKPLGLQHMIGFGWYFLGYTQHEFLPLIQVADVGGVYAVTFVVAAVNGLAREWWECGKCPTGRECPTNAPPMTNDEGKTGGPARVFPSSLVGHWWGIRHSALAVTALFAAALGYGFWQLGHAPFADGPRVAALQGSIPQGIKSGRGDPLMKVYGPLHHAAERLNPRPDLIVWPETCFPSDWLELPASSAGAPEKYATAAARCAGAFARERVAVPTLLGLNGYEWSDDKEWKYNSALLLNTDGTTLGRYDKMHLVPFGEYVPMRETFPFLKAFTPYKWDYSCRPGRRWTRFPLKVGARDYRFGCLICYEDSDPYLARQYVADPRDGVHFLVNISNDGWFDGTEEHEQHLAICRFRAVEARRAVVRAVNMGISGVIDPDGRVIALPGETWAKSVKVEGVVTAVVPIDDRPSWYAFLGDWLPGVCWAGIAVAVVVRRPRGNAEPPRRV